MKKRLEEFSEELYESLPAIFFVTWLICVALAVKLIYSYQPR